MPPRRIVDQLQDEPEVEEERTIEAADDDDGAVNDDGPEPEDDDDDGAVNDDQQEDEDPADDNDGEPAPPARQARRAPGRRENDVARLRSERRAAEQRANDLEIELARARSGGNQQTHQESEAVRNARLAAMEPQERTEYLINEERMERRRERAEDRFRESDARDRDLYRATARTNPRYKKYENEVERRLALLRSQGQNVPRESILRYIIGERVLGGQATPRVKEQKRNAQERVEREQVTLPRGRGERGSQKGSKSADLEKRLANVPI